MYSITHGFHDALTQHTEFSFMRQCVRCSCWQGKVDWMTSTKWRHCSSWKTCFPLCCSLQQFSLLLQLSICGQCQLLDKYSLMQHMGAVVTQISVLFFMVVSLLLMHKVLFVSTPLVSSFILMGSICNYLFIKAWCLSCAVLALT